MGYGGRQCITDKIQNIGNKFRSLIKERFEDCPSVVANDRGLKAFITIQHQGCSVR